MRNVEIDNNKIPKHAEFSAFQLLRRPLNAFSAARVLVSVQGTTWTFRIIKYCCVFHYLIRSLLRGSDDTSVQHGLQWKTIFTCSSCYDSCRCSNVKLHLAEQLCSLSQKLSDKQNIASISTKSNVSPSLIQAITIEWTYKRDKYAGNTWRFLLLPRCLRVEREREHSKERWGLSKV